MIEREAAKYVGAVMMVRCGAVRPAPMGQTCLCVAGARG